MRVLVACEFSGIVRDAFIAKGHDAMSADLLPTQSEGPHYLGDVRDVLYDGWDMVIAHPPCRYLSNAGVRWMMGPDGLIDDVRWMQMLEAVEFFRLFQGCAPRVCIENPKPHGYASHRMGKESQVVHPWMFGHEEQKRTHLWLENLPPLTATKVMSVRDAWIPDVVPGAEQWKRRSITYTGLAEAMADQWGSL